MVIPALHMPRLLKKSDHKGCGVVVDIGVVVDAYASTKLFHFSSLIFQRCWKSFFDVLAQ